MNNTEISKRGGVSYIAPKCETIELDTQSTICQGSAGRFDINPWENDDLGLDF